MPCPHVCPVYHHTYLPSPSSESEHVGATSKPGTKLGHRNEPCHWANKANKTNLKSPLIISGRKVKPRLFEFSIEKRPAGPFRFNEKATQSGNAGTIGYLRKKELCMELVDRLDVAEDGGEGVRVQSQGLVVPVNSAVEDLGGKSGLHLKGKMGN